MTDHFGNRVRAIMERRALTIEALAEKLRASTRWVESVIASPDVPILLYASDAARMADALDVSLDELFGRTRPVASDAEIDAALDAFGGDYAAELESMHGATERCVASRARVHALIATARERDPLDEPWEPTPVEFASPKVQAIYDKHLATAGFDAMHFGPAHIVWEDSNMERHHVQWCVDHFDERAAEGAKYADPEAPTATQLEAVRQSLLDLLALDDDDLYAYEDDSNE